MIPDRDFAAPPAHLGQAVVERKSPKRSEWKQNTSDKEKGTSMHIISANSSASYNYHNSKDSVEHLIETPQQMNW